MKPLILVFIAQFWITIGQICFKKCADDLAMGDLGNGGWIKQLLERVFKYPVIWWGALTMLIGMIFWFGALGSGDLNFVYLLGSIQYVFTLFAAHFFLQEEINLPKIIGTLLITLGIVLTVLN